MRPKGLQQMRYTSALSVASILAAVALNTSVNSVPAPAPAVRQDAADQIFNQFPLPAYLINSKASNVVIDWNHVRSDTMQCSV